MIENEAVIFTPDDYMDRIENAWLSSNNGEKILDVFLFVDFDARCLRFGLNNTVLPKFFSNVTSITKFVSISPGQLRH